MPENRRRDDPPDKDYQSSRHADGYVVQWGGRSLGVTGPLGILGVLMVLLIVLLGGSAWIGVEALKNLQAVVSDQAGQVRTEYIGFRQSLEVLISRQRDEQHQQMCLIQVQSRPEQLEELRKHLIGGGAKSPRQVLATFCPWLLWWDGGG